MRLGRRLACSFCGRHATQVDKLVAGPRVSICDRCVALASRIVADDPGPRPPASGDRPGRLARWWQRLRRAVDPRFGGPGSWCMVKSRSLSTPDRLTGLPADPQGGMA
jgi:ClpX C4-type zinc finger protein